MFLWLGPNQLQYHRDSFKLHPTHEIMKNASATIGLLLLIDLACQAENWPHWRGPNFNGSTTEKNLPATFSKTEHVKWFAELPGPSAATPVVWGRHVFVSFGGEAPKSLHAL